MIFAINSKPFEIHVFCSWNLKFYMYMWVFLNWHEHKKIYRVFALKKKRNIYHDANLWSFMLNLKGTCILIEEALSFC